ncbi:hypothetical protein TYRP_017873 [Tyrophagus putrescentiae]|nr:hypothetical protein TYRP_017873 [Tyrophagus putrescentiae]
MLFLRLRWQQLVKEVRQGFHQEPYLFFTLGLMGITVFGVSYKLSVMDNKDHYWSRHKHTYLVIRPDDARLSYYPRKHITDIEVLENYEKKKQQ